MFNVTRYDPKKSSEPKRSTESSGGSSLKRRKKDHNNVQEPHHNKAAESNEDIDHCESSSHRPLHVIAPEVFSKEHISESHKKLPLKIAEEAFDDLDLVEQWDRAETDTSQADHQTEESDGIGQDNQVEIKSALKISELALEEAAHAWNIAQFLVDNLKRDGFQRFFPIQAFAIPDVISSERYPHIQAQDVCITAPTGSGKTLAYAVPVINSLANRQIRRLRALIILPNRDLATQVHQVFENYVKGSDLTVGLAIGKSDFTAEQIALTVDDEKSDDPEMIRHRLSFEPGNFKLALKLARMTRGIASTKPLSTTKCWSTVDILVCTPGRLVDHLDRTPGFSLQHLRFLVVDEADRLMSQSYHNWIDRVIESANSASISAWKEIAKNDNKIPHWQTSPITSSSLINPITWRRGGVAGDTSAFNINDSYFSPVSAVCKPVQLRKFLVSATLTRDPRKLAALRLVNPKHFDVHKLLAKEQQRTAPGTSSYRYSMPDGLDEYTVECTAEQKPLVLLALLLEQLQNSNDSSTTGHKKLVIVFTASVDSTHRLARLLQLLWASGGYEEGPEAVVEFSSALNQKERSSLVQRCNDPKDVVSIVVCSDGMSRGMDIEHVTSVINYDVPSLAKTYLHRCGRTARAGKPGVAISLLKGGQVGQFFKLRQLIFGAEKVTRMKVKKSLVRNIVSKYPKCVAALRDVIDAEQNGELGRSEALSLQVLASIGDAKDESDNESATSSSSVHSSDSMELKYYCLG